MAKFYGIIGYGTQGEIEPGIYEDMIVEKKYQGELLKNYKSQRSTDNVIDNITISNQVSIIADPLNIFSILSISNLNIQNSVEFGKSWM